MADSDGTVSAHPSIPAPAIDPRDENLSALSGTAVKPRWMHWFCATDDLYWDGPDSQCWFCGREGAVASAPRLTSQHGFDPELVA